MIRRVEIEGFKSVAKASVELGRVNVLIGENGAGKSNFLEALAIGGAAAANKLDHEYLNARGIRVVSPELMVSAFGPTDSFKIWLPTIAHDSDVNRIEFVVVAPSGTFPLGLQLRIAFSPTDHDLTALKEVVREEYDLLAGPESASWKRLLSSPSQWQALLRALNHAESPFGTENELLSHFLIYSPEYTSLRIFRDETQILPLGIRGEGLFAHLKALAKRDEGRVLKEISDQLDLIDWFDGFEMPGDLAPGERTLRIRDRYLVEQQVFDQRSANEGFLFLLFYFTLLISPDAPKFFAIDNIDASLNPKLCTALIRRMVTLAEAHDKQLILTTHNTAVLDGLDLSDDEQRLFAVSRDSQGRSRLRRVPAPKPVGDDAPMRLSEAFLKGYLGGLPQNF